MMKRSSQELSKIWREYQKTRNSRLKNTLVEQYIPIVRYVAERVSERLPNSVQLDDLASAGVFGLMDAIERFDLKRGVKFETYCMSRIRGAMLDELRAMDWVPRLTRAKANRLAQVYAELERRLGRLPTDTELAKEMKISLEEFDGLLQELNATALVSLHKIQNNGSDQEDNRTGGIMELLSDERAEDPYRESQKRDMMEYIKKNLSAKERYILMLYYFDEATLKEIGKILSLSESRVCQLHAKVVSKLRAQLKKRKADVV